MSKNYYVHETAENKSIYIGKNTTIWQFCVILPKAVIGENCNICAHVLIENDVQMGNNVTIKSGVQLWDGVKIEDDVFIGPNVTFTNDIVPRSKKHPEVFAQTQVKKGASIGANSTIVAGIIIGEMALIGAGSVLTKNVPPYTVWYGNPAKQMGYVTEDSCVLDLQLKDKKTGIAYHLDGFKPIAK